jgi:manganese oxidase
MNKLDRSGRRHWCIRRSRRQSWRLGISLSQSAPHHDIRNFIGVSRNDLAKAVGKLASDAMVMGSSGMAMGNMEMPAPDNTLPMMTGNGQFGPIEMGGMFTAMKIRKAMARDDYSDPGPYKFPQGTVAYEVNSPSQEAARREQPATAKPRAMERGDKPMQMKTTKM